MVRCVRPGNTVSLTPGAGWLVRQLFPAWDTSPTQPTSHLRNAHLCFKTLLLLCGVGRAGHHSDRALNKTRKQSILCMCSCRTLQRNIRGRISLCCFPTPGPPAGSPSHSPPAPLGCCTVRRTEAPGSRRGERCKSGSRSLSPVCDVVSGGRVTTVSSADYHFLGRREPETNPSSKKQ